MKISTNLLKLVYSLQIDLLTVSVMYKGLRTTDLLLQDLAVTSLFDLL